MDRGLDHLVYATPDLDASVKELADRIGTIPVPGGAHPEWGTRNALIGLGPGLYLEIIGPNPEQPDPKHARPFLIDDLTDPRLVTWAYRHPKPESVLDTIQRRFDAAQDTFRTSDASVGEAVRLGPVRAMSRTRPGGSTLHWRLSDPLALPAGGVVPFVIDWGTTPHPSTTLGNECALLELSLRHPHADALRPVLDVFRPISTAPDVDLTVMLATEPGVHARLRTPNGMVDLV